MRLATAKGVLVAVCGLALAPAGAQARWTELCPAPGLVSAPSYPVSLAGVAEFTWVWRRWTASKSAMFAKVERPGLAESTARYEDQTPAPRRPVGEEGPEVYSYQQTLPIVLAMFRATYGGQLVWRGLDELSEFANAIATTHDRQFVLAPRTPCGAVAGRGDLRLVGASIAAGISGQVDYVQLAADLRHSLGNDDVLVLNGRQGGKHSEATRPDFDDFLTPVNRQGVAGRMTNMDECGGLGLPSTPVRMQPAPAAAIDLAEVAPSPAERKPAVEAASTPTLSAARRDELVRRAQPAMRQMLDVAGILLQHAGQSLLDIARVVSPSQSQAPTPAANESAAMEMPSDLYLGL